MGEDDRRDGRTNEVAVQSRLGDQRRSASATRLLIMACSSVCVRETEGPDPPRWVAS